mmetsp:Transcript_87409/g.282996  ORF Transcript_87409/g.282996 Transcript_87409/m.282996 type:complete len:235 (+) Transcript_87409:198-902(+)
MPGFWRSSSSAATSPRSLSMRASRAPALEGVPAADGAAESAKDGVAALLPSAAAWSLPPVPAEGLRRAAEGGRDAAGLAAAEPSTPPQLPPRVPTAGTGGRRPGPCPPFAAGSWRRVSCGPAPNSGLGTAATCSAPSGSRSRSQAATAGHPLLMSACRMLLRGLPARLTDCSELQKPNSGGSAGPILLLARSSVRSCGSAEGSHAGTADRRFSSRSRVLRLEPAAAAAASIELM